MKWRSPEVGNPQAGNLRFLTTLLYKVQGILVRVLQSSPIFSEDEVIRLTEDFEDIQSRIGDGYSRLVRTRPVNEEFEPDKSLFRLDDVVLQTRLERTKTDLLYFVSLGLNTVDRLDLMNHLSDDLSTQYKRVLRFLPQFHDELVRRLKGSR